MIGLEEDEEWERKIFSSWETFENEEYQWGGEGSVLGTVAS